jgi:hypothetical protein
MDQSNTSKISTSLNTIYGEGYVYMGPLTPQRYEISSKCVNKMKQKVITSNNDNQYQFKVMLLGDSGVGKFLFL